MSPADLPTELLTTIFRELNEHQETLRACALVCSRWTSASQALLFNRVNITPTSGLVDHLLMLMKTAPHLNGFVRYLELSVIDTGTRLEKLLGVVESLTGLRTVELHCVLWTNVDVPLERLLLALSRLESLRTVFVDNDSAGKLGIPRSFKFVFKALSESRVSRIGLYGIDITNDLGDVDAVELPSSLKSISLDLDGASLKRFTSWFPTRLPLSDVEIYLLMMREIPSINEVLSACTFSSAPHLRISFSMLGKCCNQIVAYLLTEL